MGNKKKNQEKSSGTTKSRSVSAKLASTKKVIKSRSASPASPKLKQSTAVAAKKSPKNKTKKKKVVKNPDDNLKNSDVIVPKMELSKDILDSVSQQVVPPVSSDVI